MLVSKNFGDLVTFARASAAWRYNSGGILVQESANVPRLSYDPITLAARGLLVEEQRTNLALNSRTSFAYYNAGKPGNENPTPITGIDGQQSAQRFTSSANGFIEANGAAVTVTPGTTVTASFYYRSNFTLSYSTRTAIKDVTNNLDITPTVVDVPGPFGFTRRQMTFVVPAGCTSALARITYASRNTGDWVELDQLQYEAGAFATSPILTTSAQVTRAADSAIITDLSKIGFNPSEGTIVIAGECYNANAVQQGGSSPRMMVLYSSTNSAENMSMYRSSAGNQGSATISTGGAGYPVTGPVIPSGSKFKMAFAYKGGDNAICVNGAAVNSLSQATLPSGIDRMSIGSYGGSSGLWSGWISSVFYFPVRLSNSKIQTLTT